jgi:hypothetical protein
MKLFNFPGLNCYYSSVVSAANAFGIPIIDAFATLFSETDFDFNPCSKSFSSKRLLTNLNHLGAHSEVFACGMPKENKSSFLQCDKEMYFIIGMDPFHIHWTPSFGRFNGYHYFLAKPAGGNDFLCYDPTYGNQKEPMTQEVIVTHAFDITSFCRSQKNSLETDDLAELLNVAEGDTLSFWQLLSQMEVGKIPPDGVKDYSTYSIAPPSGNKPNTDRRVAEKAARYVDCLIHSRLLYEYYLQNRKLFLLNELTIFTADYFNRWQAVKNGLLKASVLRDNAAVLEKTEELFSNLIRCEREAAKAICQKNGKNTS